MLRSLLLAGAANYDEMYNALRTLDVPFQASFPYFGSLWRLQFMRMEIFSIVFATATLIIFIISLSIVIMSRM